MIQDLSKEISKNFFPLLHFQGNKFEFKDDWGEQLVSKRTPVLVVFDITSEEVKVMDGVPDHLSVGQVRTICLLWSYLCQQCNWY